MSVAPPLLECTDLVAGYAKPVTRPVSLTLTRGDVLGLWGENGVGKSTLLRAIAGSARCFSGAVSRLPEVELLHHHQQWDGGAELPLTGRDICGLTGASVDAAPARLRPLLGRRLDQLSGGQTQLVRLWGCLDSRAGVLLLDEPTNNLDTAAIELLNEMILSRRAQRAMVVVSHDADFLNAICNKHITME